MSASLPQGLAGLTTIRRRSPEQVAVVAAAGIVVSYLLGYDRETTARVCSHDLGAIAAENFDLSEAFREAARILRDGATRHAVDIVARVLDKHGSLSDPHRTIASALTAAREEPSGVNPFTASHASIHEAAHSVVAYLTGSTVWGVCVK